MHNFFIKQNSHYDFFVQYVFFIKDNYDKRCTIITGFWKGKNNENILIF